MSLENARQFVARMREDNQFRQAVRLAAADDDLPAFLQRHDHGFALHHLVTAMAGCMDELASVMDQKPQAETGRTP